MWWIQKLFEINAIEDVSTKWIDFVIFNIVCHWDKHNRVGDGCPWSLLFKDDLSLLVKLGPFFDIRNNFCFLDQIFKWLVAPVGTVGATNTITAEENREEVVGITVITGPA